MQIIDGSGGLKIKINRTEQRVLTKAAGLMRRIARNLPDNAEVDSVKGIAEVLDCAAKNYGPPDE